MLHLGIENPLDTDETTLTWLGKANSHQLSTQLLGVN
jgi:hypothetical protein